MLISIKNLSYRIGINHILFKNLNFDIKSKEVIAITGPNGSGKTTLVKILMGFIKDYQGKLIHHGNKQYAYLPQNFETSEYIDLSVKEFLQFTEKKNLKINLEQAIKLICIENLLKINIKQLSGGQLRKVLLVKSLIGANEIIFLDEPTCWLDFKAQQEFYELIQKINQLTGIAIVIISHDQNLLNKNFSQIISLEKDHLCYSANNNC